MIKINQKSFYATFFLLICLFSLGIKNVWAQTDNQPVVKTQCNDGIDNNKDGKADRYGVYDKNGKMIYDADPSCFSLEATQELNDSVSSSIIPCTDKCTFSDVFLLLNNIITFFIKTLLIPIFVVIIIYAGYKYFKAGASGGQKANVKKMLGNVLLGLILILCSWLIVRTLMTTLLNDQFKQSGVEFLGN